MRRIPPAALVLMCLLLAACDPPVPPEPPVVVPDTVAVVYVYEKDDTAVPPGVAAALAKLNADGTAVATEFEQNTVDGTGETPEQYKVALAAAQSAGLPTLVVLHDGVPVKHVVNPQTMEDVMEAVQ